MVKKWVSLSALIVVMSSAFTAFAYETLWGPLQSCCNSSWVKNWFVDADYLCLRACEDGLEYVRYEAFESSPNLSTVNSRSPKFKWDSGFRVGLGYRGECDCWYSALTWTHFNTRAKDRVNAPPIAFGYEVITRSLFDVPFALPEAFFSADAQWKLNYDIVDLDVGAPYCLNARFVAKPFVGLRSATIDQCFNNSVTTVDGTAAATTRIERSTNDYHGFGFHAGVDLTWKLWRDFSIYGKAAGSLVYGRFKIKDRVDSAASTLLYTTRHNSLRSNLEGAIGLQVVTGFCNNTQQLTIRLGYELIQWFDQNQFPGPITPQLSRSSSLGLQGMQLSGRYDF